MSPTSAPVFSFYVTLLVQESESLEPLLLALGMIPLSPNAKPEALRAWDSDWVEGLMLEGFVEYRGLNNSLYITLKD